MTVASYFGYHKRAMFLKKALGHGSGEQVWQQVESEFLIITGKMRYKTYNSFRKCHSDFITEMRKRKNVTK